MNKILQQIIKDSRNGDYGLIEKILETVPEYSLMMALPKDLKAEITADTLDNPIYVVEMEYGDGSIELQSYFDEIEGMSAYHIFLERKKTQLNNIKLLKGKIIGGNEDIGWNYDLSNSTILGQEYFNLDATEGYYFKANITFTIEGKASEELNSNDLNEILKELEPIIYNKDILGATFEQTKFKIEINR